MMLQAILGVTAALGLPFLVSWTLTRWLIRAAPRLGLIDQPSQRKIHTTPTPKGGGLAIFLAVCASQCAPALRFETNDLLLGIGSLIVVLGLLDDRYALRWQLRLGVQVLAAVLVLALMGAIPGLSELLGTGEPSVSLWLPWPLAVIWIVGLTNAFNMLDNMDALSAGTAFLVAGLLAVARAFSSVAFLMAGLLTTARALSGEGGFSWQVLLPYLVLMGATGGFLWFNRPPARIFMGDAGSTFLGFFLGVLSLQGTFASREVPQTWTAPICFLAVPWYDLTVVVLIRLSQGRSPFEADKQHISHRLVRLGLTPPRAVGVIYLCGLAVGVLGLFVDRLPLESVPIVVVQILGGWLVLVALEFGVHQLLGRVRHLAVKGQHGSES